MRKSFTAVLAMLALPGSIGVLAQRQGPLSDGAVSTSSDGAVRPERAPLSNFRIHVRNANTDELAGSIIGSEAGQFSFSDLQPANYVVELVGASGKVVGVSSSLRAAAGSTVTVTVGAAAAGALAASGGTLNVQGLGPLASVAVAGATSASGLTPVMATREGRIVVCHRGSGVSQALAIKESARESHVGHGDTLGPCAASPAR